MNFTVYAGIGILLVLTIIGVLILLRRNSFKSENSKRICIVAGTLQAVHIILYLTGLLEKIACNADDDPQDKEAQRQTLRAARLNIYNADSHNEQAG